VGKLVYSIAERKGVVTFTYGRYVESFDIRGLGMYEVYERIRFAALTAGLPLSQDSLEQLLREVKRLV
jgi:hypothetical protein